LASFLVIIIAILALIMGRNSANITETATGNGLKRVNLVNVASFRMGNDFVSANGIVSSRGQADLKSVMSAPVETIYVSIGDVVSAGDIILELENADIRAQLEQAQASLAMAEGQYATGGVSLESARSNAIDKVRDSYLKGYEAVITQIDPLLFNNDGNRGRLSSMIVDSKLNNQIISIRIDLNDIFRNWEKINSDLTMDSSDEDIALALKTSAKNLATIDKLLNNISQALNDAARFSTDSFFTFVNNWKAVVSLTRASISGASASLIATESAFSSADSSYNLTASAGVAIASAGVSNLRAQLAKTIIRSPIYGKIASLPIGVGELASPGQVLASVISESGLEIKAYASGEDISRIKVGAKVNIGNMANGIVESVAPSVNSTNKKVEVKIGINDESDISTTSAKEKLVIGESVQVSILVDRDMIKEQKEVDLIYKLPIQDVKIVPGDAYVLVVDEESRIKSKQVILGKVDGDFIEVKGGLTDDMNIVSPVYELDEGEEVVTE